MMRSGSRGGAEIEQERADFQVGRERVGRADLLPQGGGGNDPEYTHWLVLRCALFLQP